MPLAPSSSLTPPTPHQVVTMKMSPDIAKCPWGTKPTPVGTTVLAEEIDKIQKFLVHGDKCYNTPGLTDCWVRAPHGAWGVRGVAWGGWGETLVGSGQEKKWSGVLNTEQPVGDTKEKGGGGGRWEGWWGITCFRLRLGMRKCSGQNKQVTFKDPEAVKWRVTQV